MAETVGATSDKAVDLPRGGPGQCRSDPPAAPADDPEIDRDLAVVLLALAGVRRGDSVAEVAAGPRLRAALLAGAGVPGCSRAGCAVAVSGTVAGVPAAAAALGEQGRLVAPAGGAVEAQRLALSVGVVLQHAVPVGDGVAWSGRRPRPAG